VVSNEPRGLSLGRVVTAADAKFAPFATYLKQKAQLLGYPVTVFDLGGLGYGVPLETDHRDLVKKSFVPCVFKPRAIRRALEITKEEYLIWIDSDCTIEEKIDEIFTSDYDVGVTRRDEAEVYRYRNNPRVGEINSGVIFFRRSERLADFLDRWELRAIAHNLEQQGQNVVPLAHGPFLIRVTEADPDHLLFRGSFFLCSLFRGSFLLRRWLRLGLRSGAPASSVVAGSAVWPMVVY